jgi:hypothetical protein
MNAIDRLGPRATPGPVRAKPMTSAVRIALCEREVRERLSRAALDLLFARAECLSEGQRERRGGRDAYFGSTMLTFDLPRLAGVLRDACDAATARRLAALLDGDTGVATRVRAVALAEAKRLAGAPVKRMATQIAVRAQGARVFVDVDVEAGL